MEKSGETPYERERWKKGKGGPKANKGAGEGFKVRLEMFVKKTGFPASRQKRKGKS